MYVPCVVTSPPLTAHDPACVQRVPDWVERGAEVFWGISSFFAIWQCVHKYRSCVAVERAAIIQRQVRQGTGQGTSSEAAGGADATAVGAQDADDASEAISAAAFARHIAFVKLLKNVADAGQSLPGLVDWEAYPDICDHLSGFASGLLSTYVLWVKHKW